MSVVIVGIRVVSVRVSTGPETVMSLVEAGSWAKTVSVIVEPATTVLIVMIIGEPNVAPKQQVKWKERKEERETKSVEGGHSVRRFN